MERRKKRDLLLSVPPTWEHQSTCEQLTHLKPLHTLIQAPAWRRRSPSYWSRFWRLEWGCSLERGHLCRARSRERASHSSHSQSGGEDHLTFVLSFNLLDTFVHVISFRLYNSAVGVRFHLLSSPVCPPPPQVLTGVPAKWAQTQKSLVTWKEHWL